MADLVSTHSGSVAQVDDVAIPQVVNGGPANHTVNGGAANHTVAVAPEQPQVVWPTETELLTFPGTTKVMLTVQRPLMRAVIQGAFEQVQKALAFKDAFPNTFTALEFTRDGLVAAAESHEQATDIYNRLLCDADYMNRMTRLVSFLILIKRLLIYFFSPVRTSRSFRADIKERCVAIVQTEFLSIGSDSAVAQIVQKQLANYNYTFPSAANVSVVFPQSSS
jgi:hypothetical protein